MVTSGLALIFLPQWDTVILEGFGLLSLSLGIKNSQHLDNHYYFYIILIPTLAAIQKGAFQGPTPSVISNTVQWINSICMPTTSNENSLRHSSSIEREF